MRRTTRTPLAPLALVAIAATVLSLAGVRYLPLARIAEQWLQDVRVATMTPAVPQSGHIAIVAIDEQTLSAFPYRSPIDRGFLADLLRTLAAHEVRAIGLDILLDQPTEPAKDAALAEAITAAGVPVVVAWAEAADEVSTSQLDFLQRYVGHLPHGVPGVLVDEVDGNVRALELRRHAGAAEVPSFVAALARATGVAVPAGASLRIAYRGSADAATSAFPIYPAHAAALLPREWFAGRIVLVGAVTPFADRHRTPLALARDSRADTPGVVILAHALDQLVEGRRLPLLAGWQQAALVLALAVLGVGGGLARLSLAARCAATAAVIAGGWALGFWLYGSGGPLVPLLAPTLSLAAAAAATVALAHRREQARARFIRDAFSRFLAPSVVEQLLADPERLTLSGERRDTSFMFTDLANFTALTERSEPDLVVRLLNDYLDGTCRIVLRHEGTLDKIVGDALHVMFNAPATQPDHPARAVRCALELDRFCQDFADRQRAEGIPFGLTRIGVNTGVTVVGNVGGDTRFDYSARGDAINTTARLESLNKHLGTRVCVSGATAERCTDVVFRQVGALVLKGKQQPIDVFEPVTDPDPARAPLAEYRQAYALLDEDPRKARQRFDELSARYPADSLVAFHAARLARGGTGSTMVMTEK